MEPADLNSPDSAKDDARLAAFLRDAAPSLPDEGFSARVLAALPREETPRFSWLRVAFGAAGALAGCGFALSRGLDLPVLQAELPLAGTAFANAAPLLVNPWLVGALTIAALSVLYAFRSELSEKLLS